MKNEPMATGGVLLTGTHTLANKIITGRSRLTVHEFNISEFNELIQKAGGWLGVMLEGLDGFPAIAKIIKRLKGHEVERRRVIRPGCAILLPSVP